MEIKETFDHKRNTNEYQELGIQNSESTSNSEHKLEYKWTIWYVSRKDKDYLTPYAERIKKVASFSTLEEFFRYYMFLKSASEVTANTDIAYFKEDYKPLWESCPDGACWFIRFRKNEDSLLLDVMWEKLIFALIGEQFEDRGTLGAVLSRRGRETIIELWFNYKKDEEFKAYLLEKMRVLLSMDTSFYVYFKENDKAIQDKSTLKNAKLYNLAGTTRKNTYY